MKEHQLEKELIDIVGDRVTTSQFERWFYASDIMHIPGAVKSVVKPMPSAVVKPSDTRQVSAIVRYCCTHGIPLVPRGAGSSGLFGSVPKHGGVVIDLTGMDKIIHIDVEHQTVTAEAGATWWQLENRLNQHGLSLMTYPSSAISATLGGWIMTSGLGIGSLKYGPVSGHVVSAELVLPDGGITEYTAGPMLERFFATEGMLAVLTKVTLKVRKIPECASRCLLYFANIKDLFEVVAILAREQNPPYNVELMDSGYLNLVKAAGFPAAESAEGSGVLLAAYDGTNSEVEEGKNRLAELAGQYHGVEREGGEEEWQQRFNMLRVKRAVPSLILSSVYVPLRNLIHFYAKLRNINKRRIGLIGHVTANAECNLMPVIETDQRKNIEYVFALHTPREISNLALSFDGKPGGGIGVWNAPYKNKILGKARINEIKKLKALSDPKNILNPGMWPDPPLLFQPQVYQFTMGAASILDKLPTGPGKMETVDFKQELSNCVQCGYCMSFCPAKQSWLSSTPRGRILMTRDVFLHQPQGHKDLEPDYLNSIFQCTLCGRCRVDCSVDIKSREMWLGVRDHLVRNGLGLDSLKAMTGMVNDIHNISGRSNDQRTNWINRVKLPYDLQTKRTAEIVYFVGCVSSFFPVAQGVARSFVQILNASGLDFTIVGGDEWCCGFPLMSAGESAAAEKCIRHNLERLKQLGAKTVVTTCPGCYRVWKEEYRNVSSERHPFKVLHSTELIAGLIRDNKINIKGLTENITYHDPCDLGRNGGIFDEPRYIMQKISGLNYVELKANGKYCSCCGSGGDLLASNQELAMLIARRKVEEIMETGAQAVATACPSCIRAIHMAKASAKVKLDVVDITELVWKSMGG